MSPRIVHSERLSRRRWPRASDHELLDELRRNGDEAAFDELVARKSGPLLRLAGRLVGDREEARDLVQLTFLRVWQHRTNFDGRYSPNTWIYRIATNLAIDYLRSKGGRDRHQEPYRRQVLHLVEARRRRQLADLDRREVEGILRRVTEGLPERQRLVFLLREVEGLSSREVAAILGCRESTVRNHLFAARKRLRREIRTRFPEYAPEGGAA